MTLQTSGQISLLDLKTEFSGSTPVNLGDYYRGSALNTSSSTNVPTSGDISIGMFYGLSAINLFNLNQTISADINKYNLQTQLVNAGWNGVDIVNVTVTINENIVVYSDDIAIPALSIPNTIPDGSTININNNGYIIGMGGAGGTGPIAGTRGGTAIKTVVPTSISNLGTIGGGGGGGAGYKPSKGSGSTSGGGGRSGRMNSIGANAGTFDSAGNGGTSAGRGGDWGASGEPASQGIAGAGGNAVEGNSYITWIATGTIKGALT